MEQTKIIMIDLFSFVPAILANVMPLGLTVIFGLLMLVSALVVILAKNPVTSALGMLACFVTLAALFIGLDAFFIGILQILVYAGAVMVLFLFIIMLLDLKEPSELEMSTVKPASIILGIVTVLLLLIQIGVVLSKIPTTLFAKINHAQAAKYFDSQSVITAKLNQGILPDAHLIGQALSLNYAFALQLIGIILLLATIGVIVIGQKSSH